EFLLLLTNGGAPRFPQDTSQATYTCVRTPADGRIDWTQPTACIYNLIRALAPPTMPGAWTTLAGDSLIIRSAAIIHAMPNYVGRVPGRVVRILDGPGPTRRCWPGCSGSKPTDCCQPTYTTVICIPTWPVIFGPGRRASRRRWSGLSASTWCSH
ncbi:MAG: hypothetical protein HUU35_00210, partial [Armatimonadetes bacterium]|nr:hypothetical protein [Armatimonadota bacterium]